METFELQMIDNGNWAIFSPFWSTYVGVDEGGEPHLLQAGNAFGNELFIMHKRDDGNGELFGIQAE